MAAMQSYASFETILKYSRMYNYILDHCNHDQYSELFGILLKIIEPVLIDSFHNHGTEITTLFKQFIFSCFKEYHECDSQEYTQHFHATAPCLEQMFIDLQEEFEESDEELDLTFYLEPKKYNNLFEDIPHEILVHSMSFIDAMDLQTLELVSHRFLQSARAPTARQILSEKLLHRILRTKHREDDWRNLDWRFHNTFHRHSMRRYVVSKEVHINKQTLDSLMITYALDDINSVLSWFSLNDESVRYLYTLNKELYDGNLNTLNMNILRGLQYYPVSATESSNTLCIDVENWSLWYWPFFDDYLVWNRYYQIRTQFERFRYINISLNMREADVSTRFIWFAACCHANIEYLSITYFSWNCSTYHSTALFMENYYQIIPELSKLKHLSITCPADDDPDNLQNHIDFVKDGVAFVDALLLKIRHNTLEELRINQWCKSWFNVEDLRLWILKHYKTLSTLQFCMGTDGVGTAIYFEIGSVEIWKPFILLHEIITHSTASKELDYWVKNVLRNFEFMIALENPEDFGWSLDQYLNFFQDTIPELKKVKLNLKIADCIRYFVHNGIEWNICVNACLQRPFKGECDRDPLSIYSDFFLNSKMNEDEYMLEFVDQHQTLITDHFA
eukprot:46744_1